MKKSNFLVLLSALALCACGNNESSSTNENKESSLSTVVSSESEVESSSVNDSSSESSSSSENIDKTYWIEKGNAEASLLDPNKWFYNIDESKVNLTNASYFEGELFFDFNKKNDLNWNDIQLFYHNASIESGITYEVKFEISSITAGKITVNGETIELSTKNQEVAVQCVLLDNEPALTINFGTEQDGYLGDSEIIISNLSFSIQENKTLKDTLLRAQRLNNYTIEMTYHSWGFTGKYTFLEKAAFFEVYAAGASTQYRGFGENHEGVFGFSSSSGTVLNRHTNYFYDENTEVVKGLYTNREKIDFEDSKGESLGVPSLHHLKAEDFDYELKTGESIKLSGSNLLNSLKVFARMGGDEVNTLVYSGVTKATAMLNADGSIEFTISNIVSDKITLKLSNIGKTTNAILEEFINSNNFGPINMTPSKTADPAVIEILRLINSENYTVEKANGEYLYLNEKYSYALVQNEDGTSTHRGFINANDGVYQYSIIDGRVILGDMDYTLFDNWSIANEEGLTSSAVTYFDNALDFEYNEVENRYELIPLSNNSSYLSFSKDWLGLTATACNLITLEKNETDNTIIIGANVTYVNESEEEVTEMKYITVSNFGTTTVQALEDYLG